MKQILRIFAVVGVILITALISAGSCDKKKDGGGGGLDANIVVTATSGGPATVSGSKITLSAAKFAADAIGAAGTFMGAAVKSTETAKYKEAFTVEFKAATAGMILAVDGDKTDINKLTTPKPGATLPTDAAADKGVHITLENVAATADVGTLKKTAINIVATFADTTAVTADNAADAKAPFAFSASKTTGKIAQPVLWCVAALPATVVATDGSGKLTGGQKAYCYVATRGESGLGTAATATDWLATKAPFKKMIKVSFAGLSTGDTAIKDLGIGTDAAKSLEAFNAGLDATKVAAMVTKLGKGKSGLSTYTIEVAK